MEQSDKIDEIIAGFTSPKFEEWKPFLTRLEQVVFGLKYFKHFSTAQISNEIYYNERAVKKYLKSAKKKIKRQLP